jgi:hypothetical protein
MFATSGRIDALCVTNFRHMFNRKTSRPSSVRAILAAVGLSASIAIGALATSGAAAGARVKTGDKGSLAATCRAYQDDYDRTMSELQQARANGDYQKAYELRIRLGLIRNYWDDECSDNFGSIAYLVVTSTNTDGTAAQTSGGVVDGGGTSPKTAAGAAGRVSTARVQ